MPRLTRVLLWLSAFLLGGCASSQIIQTNPRLVADADQAHAEVYFIRPRDDRTRGVADEPLSVELGRDKLLDLGVGEYVLVRLEPGVADVVMRSLTYMTNEPNPVAVWRSRRYDFEAGRTYYIVARQHHEEFRGIYYVPEHVDRHQAREAAERLKPVGEITRQAPLG